MKTEKIQVYKVESDSILIAQLTESEIAERGFFYSPIDAVNDALSALKYLQGTKEYQQREKTLNNLIYAIKERYAKKFDGFLV